MYAITENLVALFVNTVAFEGRRAVSSAFRSLRLTTGGTPQSRALMRPPYDPLGTLPLFTNRTTLPWMSSGFLLPATPTDPYGRSPLITSGWENLSWHPLRYKPILRIRRVRPHFIDSIPLVQIYRDLRLLLWLLCLKNHYTINICNLFDRTNLFDRSG